MIQPQDLRIGNIITDFSGRHIKVTSINKNGISARAEHSTIKISYDLVQPIPLTEEVLVKCGFEKINNDPDNSWLRLTNRIHTFEADESTQFEIVYVDVHGYKCGYAKTIHQLQNLYYALTGKELIYKP